MGELLHPAVTISCDSYSSLKRPPLAMIPQTSSFGCHWLASHRYRYLTHAERYARTYLRDTIAVTNLNGLSSWVLILAIPPAKHLPMFTLRVWW